VGGIVISDDRRLFSDDRRLLSFNRRLRRKIPRLGIFLRRLLSFLRSLQIFLRRLLLTEKSLLFWMRWVHWVHGIFVSPIVFRYCSFSTAATLFNVPKCSISAVFPFIEKATNEKERSCYTKK